MKISQYIPSVTDFCNRTPKKQRNQVSDASRGKIRELLRATGYIDWNGLCGVIIEYGAKMAEGIAEKGLFVKGSTGVGKTFGVSVLAAHFKWPVINAKVFEQAFLDDQDDFDSLVESLDFFERHKVLVIDDLGFESHPIIRYGTQYCLMADVIDARYRLWLQSGVQTVVTTNLSDAQIMNRYGGRTYSRLQEMFDIVNVESKIDLRII